MSRITVTLWTCGRCGKPRGLHHACSGHRSGRDRVRLGLSFTCPSCGKATANPLTHTCSVPSDFKRRKAAEKRRRQAEERKRRRKAAAARKRARARERKRQAAERRKAAAAEAAAARRRRARSQTHDRDRHEYADCADPYCGRTLCRVYREGGEAVRPEAESDGYAKGYSDGMNACPLRHQ